MLVKKNKFLKTYSQTLMRSERIKCAVKDSSTYVSDATTWSVELFNSRFQCFYRIVTTECCCQSGVMAALDLTVRCKPIWLIKQTGLTGNQSPTITLHWFITLASYSHTFLGYWVDTSFWCYGKTYQQIQQTTLTTLTQCRTSVQNKQQSNVT